MHNNNNNVPVNCPTTETRSMGRSHTEKRASITRVILTENGQVEFNICALIFSSLLKMFSRFRNIFDTKSASVMLSSWFFMDIKFMNA